MLARFSAAGLGLFAFTVAILAGVWVNNPFTLVLSRGLLALIVFFFIGLALGAVADAVVTEHSKAKEIRIRENENPDRQSAEISAGPGEQNGRAVQRSVA